MYSCILSIHQKLCIIIQTLSVTLEESYPVGSEHSIADFAMYHAKIDDLEILASSKDPGGKCRLTFDTVALV